MAELSNATIYVASYSTCAFAYLLLFLLVLSSRTRTLYRNLILIACGATVLWSGSLVAWQMWGLSPAVVILAELVRDAAWLAFLTSLVASRPHGWFSERRWVLPIAVAVMVTFALAIDLMLFNVTGSESLIIALARVSNIVQMLIAVFGLVLLEDLYRNADVAGRWALKYLTLALGGLFAYDFLLYAHAVLFLTLDSAFLQTRGLVNALAVPLLAVSVTRAKTWQVDIQVSRTAVFHSVVLMAAGGYLLVVAAAGYYVRQFGGDWGEVLQIFLVTAALFVLAALFTSDSLRAHMRVFISKNFYSHRFDYRVEWLRFINAMSEGDDSDRAPMLRHRVLRAVTSIIESPAGGLWVLQQQDNSYVCSASYAFGAVLPAIPVSHPLVAYLEDNEWIILTEEFKEGLGRYDGLELPEWLADHARAWMIVPLIHRNTLYAIMVMDAPKGGRRLTWEDFDLLKTVGRQAAGYIAEEHALEVLSDARKLEAFNQRFAFVVHDIKNLVSQMSLMMKNAEKFGDNPDFQKDMLATVGNSIVRMKSMLEQLNAERQQTADAEPGAAETAGKKAQEHAPDDRAMAQNILDGVVSDWRKQLANLEVDLADDLQAGVADGERFLTVLNHLLQNAVEAAGEDGRICLRSRTEGFEAVVEVEDNGAGMDPDFVRDRLFSPFDTEKRSGYGLGAYQTRQFVRELGGRLEVDSEVGRGTIMRVILPRTTAQPGGRNSTVKAVKT